MGTPGREQEADQPEGAFSNFRPEILKAAPAFQILERVAHQTTIKQNLRWYIVG